MLKATGGAIEKQESKSELVGGVDGIAVCGSNFATPVTNRTQFIREIHYRIGDKLYIENADIKNDDNYNISTENNENIITTKASSSQQHSRNASQASPTEKKDIYDDYKRDYSLS